MEKRTVLKRECRYPSSILGYLNFFHLESWALNRIQKPLVICMFLGVKFFKFSPTWDMLIRLNL